MYKLKVIKADGSVRTVEVDKHPSLEELQDLIGGWIEHHKVPYQSAVQKDMLMDEDGRLKDLPFNCKASMIARFPVVGTVVYYEEGRFN